MYWSKGHAQPVHAGDGVAGASDAASSDDDDLDAGQPSEDDASSSDSEEDDEPRYELCCSCHSSQAEAFHCSANTLIAGWSPDDSVSLLECLSVY